MPLERPMYCLANGARWLDLFTPHARLALSKVKAPVAWAEDPATVSALVATAFAGLADLKSPKAKSLPPDVRERLEAERTLIDRLSAENNNAWLAALGELNRQMHRLARKPKSAFGIALSLAQRPALLALKSDAIAWELSVTTGSDVGANVVKKAIALLRKSVGLEVLGFVTQTKVKFRGDFGPPRNEA